MSEESDRHDKQLQKEALKEVIQETLAKFGLWSLKSFVTLVAGGLMYLWIQTGFWHIK